nr:hypothetical protein [uncultured Friedmanniella sp.]
MAASLIPITCPSPLATAPPLLPGLIGAPVWMTSLLWTTPLPLPP